MIKVSFLVTVLLPILMENIEKRPFMLKYGKFINAPMQVFLSGLR